MMHPKKYRQLRKNSSENVNSQFGRAALFLKKENFSAKLSKRWKRIRAALLAEFPFQAFIMITFGTIWGWDLYILPKIAEYKLKNPDNIKSGCITYLYHHKGRVQEKVYFLLNNEKKVSDIDMIPSSLIIDFPSSNEYRHLRNKIIQEDNKTVCRPIEYIELISLPFWQEIYVYRFK